MLDADLAFAYGIEVRALNQAVKRNAERFPSDFMFQLTELEFDNLISQFVISSSDSKSASPFNTSIMGGRRTPPYAFTEQGVAMLSSVLRSPVAIKMNISIMRTFVAARRYFAEPKNIGKELKRLEKVLMLHIDDTNLHLGEHAKSINDIIAVLNELTRRPEPVAKRKIGFVTD